MSVDDDLPRCSWAAGSTPAMIAYHDKEWGVPIHKEAKLFEFITLEGAQAGLSWNTILNKRQNYRDAFENFDVAKVAKFDKRDVTRLLRDTGIVRNRLKIESTIANAHAILSLRTSGTTLDDYLWHFVDGKPIVNRPKTLDGVPAETELSMKISKDLRSRGFRFVGPTIVYAFMQATGMVDDHLATCFKATKR